MMCFTPMSSPCLQYWSGLVQHDEERLLKRLVKCHDKGQAAARKKQAAELNNRSGRAQVHVPCLPGCMRTGRRGVSRNTTSLCCPGSTKANRLNWTQRLNSFKSAIATQSHKRRRRRIMDCLDGERCGSSTTDRRTFEYAD